jgi:PAS domain-containing protein
MSLSSPPQPSKPGARSAGLLARVARARVRHIVAAAVVLGAVCAEIAVLVPAALLTHQEEVRRLETETLMMLRANVDPTSFLTVPEAVRVGHRLTTFSIVRGGTIVNVLGEELGSFGLPPALTFPAVRRDGVTRLLTPRQDYLDVFFSADATGLAHPLILRLDASRVPSGVIARLLEKAGTVLVVALVVGVAIALMLTFLIVRPILKIRDAATAATDDPGRADTFRLGWKRSDEVGDAGRAFDLLLTAVSIVHQEDLAASQEAVQRSAFASLTYDPGGRLMNANAAALKLFGVATQEQIASLDEDYVRLQTVGESIDISPIALLSRGDVAQLVSVVTPKGVRRCYMSATTVRRKNSTVLRHMVSFLDLSWYQPTQPKPASSDSAELAKENASLRQRSAELRAFFESCLSLLSAVELPSTREPVEPDESAPIVPTDRIVNGWFTEAVRSGLVAPRAAPTPLPAVRGAPETVEAVFRQALLTVYTRSPLLKPVLSVSGSVVDRGLAAFEIGEAVADINAPQRGPEHASQAGAAIATLAFTQALHKIGGKLADVGAPGRRALLFWVPTTAEAELDLVPAKPATTAERAYAGALRG